jgi:hypothetical protein
MGESMSEQKPPATPQLSDNPAIFKALPGGTVLYEGYPQAKQGSQQLKDSKHAGDAAKNHSQVKLVDTYLGNDGQALTYNLAASQFTELIGVILVLLCLGLIIPAIRRRLRPQHDSRTPARPAPVSGIHPGLTDQQLVVILTAAAQEALGGPVRIRRYRPVTARDLSWSAIGRSMLQSHRLK